jgi:hypothetical protein
MPASLFLKKYLSGCRTRLGLVASIAEREKLMVICDSPRVVEKPQTHFI